MKSPHSLPHPSRSLPNEQALNEIWKCYLRQGPGDISENQLVQHYLHLVQTVVGRLAMHLPPHVSSEDLHSAGLIGLLEALRNFDATRGSNFEPYARMRIKGAALDELRRTDWVPRSVHSKARKVQKALLKLEAELQRVPTDVELAQSLGLSSKEYEKLLAEIRPATFVCLDSLPVTSDSDSGNEQILFSSHPESDTRNQVSKRELAALICGKMKELPEAHRKVLALYYFEDLRLREIAEVMGLSESRICQIHSKAILSIRAHMDKVEQGHSDDDLSSFNNRLAA